MIVASPEMPHATWQIRNLVQDDFDDVYNLCRASFPLNYPHNWYRDVVNGTYISFGLFFTSPDNKPQLTSLLVAELKRVCDCDIEDQCLHKDPGAYVIYILSLAVNELFRRQGIATVLLKFLMSTYVGVHPFPKLVYLHVLSLNESAIKFYQKNGFIHFATLKNYYEINGSEFAGCTFVYYTKQKSIFWPLKEFLNFVVLLISYPFRNCCFRLNVHSRRLINI